LEADRVKKLEDIITERRLRWLGQVLHMLETKIPYHIICCEFEQYRRRPDWPRKTWSTLLSKTYVT